MPSTQQTSAHISTDGSKLQILPLTYDNAESRTSALRIILSLRPEWEQSGKIEIVRFTDGITNTLLKVVNKRPGLSAEDLDNEAILLRAYGKGTDVLIDREREFKNHALLTGYKLAPALVARFQNGMLYRFIRGAVTTPADLRRQSVWRGVAKRLAEWHARIPFLPTTRAAVEDNGHGIAEFGLAAPTPGKVDAALQDAIDKVAPGKIAPNIWTVMQKWIYALPVSSEAEQVRQKTLQKELVKFVNELSQRPGLGDNGLVFGHCDLLSGNIIILPHHQANDVASSSPSLTSETVSFIDFEYAVASPAAFDIANHFAEWGGFQCSYDVLPTRSQRLDFIREYIRSYFSFLPQDCVDEEEEVKKLFEEVDVFRGVPGFYWAIWALIQAQISHIDFDYQEYAELRLAEYWGWRGEESGERREKGEEMSLREKRWMEE